ncbi:MAG: Rieske (2Fe-2S) protein [Xanthomonadales bacterium]|nr:Rieske (2Fe-2S) protein [Xanthomonadales bacterium]
MDQIADGGAVEVRVPGPPVRFVALLRRGDQVLAFANACPHAGRPMNVAPDKFLFSPEGELVCAVHGATFRLPDGECVAGPCVGARLEVFPVEVEDGQVFAGQG